MRKHAPKSVLARLREVPLFASCTTRQLRKVAALGATVDLAPGHEVLSAGTPGAEWFVVLSGRATCRVGGTEVASFGPGDFFGEVSLIGGGPRSAAVVADTDLRLLDLHRGEFDRLLEIAPSVTRAIVATAAARVEADAAPASAA